jgi:hypothetical protein
VKKKQRKKNWQEKGYCSRAAFEIPLAAKSTTMKEGYGLVYERTRAWCVYFPV